ncbi:P-loop containing nucleoside triphosphate hydrolase protein [Pilobolus umbonatus]|nr:P-loop containing nucleoside triphosphate hydrolase protein [Pilobolus umbonatus]
MSFSMLRCLTRYTVKAEHRFISRTAINYTLRYASQTTFTKTPVKESVQLRSDIIKFLYEHKQRPIPTAEKNTILTTCPHCINIRKNSFSAYLNVQHGSYKCKTCNTKGSFNEFSKTLLEKTSHPEIKGEIISAASLISHHDGYNFMKSLEEIEQYPAHLHEHSELLDDLAHKHKINRDIWETYQVGLQESNGEYHLTFPQTTLVYKPEEEEADGEMKESFKLDTVRVKVCDLDDPFHQAYMDPPVLNPGIPSGLFGYQTAEADSQTIIITRNELDAMAAYQSTGIPAVSIPTSNYQLQESTLPLLERFSQVYIWMDDDVDGHIAAERFSQKIGQSKCSIISTRLGNHHGPLTAYQALQEGKDLKKMVALAKKIKHDKIVDFHDLREDVYNEILHPEQSNGVLSTDLIKFNEILKGHRPGELTILTGPTGAGKTTVISQLSLDFCKSGVPTLWGSFEILNKRLAKKMLYQYAGQDLSLKPDTFDEVADKFEQLPLYFLKFFSSTSIKDVLKACQHAVYAYDIRHIILDNLQFMLSQQARGSADKWELQDHAVAELRSFATIQDVHITLVVHPRKDIGEELDINSVFGSAKVTQEADNVIILQKTGEGGVRKLDIKKNRYDGTLGSIYYTFNKDTLKIEEADDVIAKKYKSGRGSFDRKPYPMASETIIGKKALSFRQ